MTEISGKASAKASAAQVKPKTDQPAKTKSNLVKTNKPKKTAPKKPVPPITSGRTGVLARIKNKAVEYIGIASDSLSDAETFINDTLSTISIVGEGYVSDLFSKEKKPLPVGERAFKKLFDVADSDMELLRQVGALEGDQDAMTICHNLLMVREEMAGSSSSLTAGEKEILTLLDKIKAKIDEFNDYLQYEGQIRNIIDFESDQAIKDLFAQRDEIVHSAFMESWSFINEDPYFGPVADIAAKYGISDPLSLTTADYRKMSIREETALKQAIQYTISTAVSNLSSAQFEKYTEVREKISERVEQIYLEHLRTIGSPHLEMALRVSQANEILNESNVSAPDLEGLSWKQGILLKEFVKAGKNLAAALATSDTNDDAEAKNALENIRQAILREIESSYMDAFVDKPTDPEKQEFINFIRAASELEINDKKLVFYSRAAESVFSAEERELFLGLEANGKSIFAGSNLPEISFISLGSMTADGFIARYGEEARPYLEWYASEVRKDIENHVEHQTGRTKAEALFNLLTWAGCSEAELLKLDAVIAAEYLSPEDRKKIFSGNVQAAINVLLERMRSNFDREDFPKKEQLLNNLILYAAAGSILNGNQLLNSRLFDVRFGSRILSELETAEYTPELTDDFNVRKILAGFSRETGIDAFSIASAHLRARKYLNMPPDEDFLSSVLNNGYFMEMTGIAGPEIDGMKMEIMNWLIANEFEDKKSIQASKKKIQDLYVKMLNDARDNAAKTDSKEALSYIYPALTLAGIARKVLQDFKIFTGEELDELNAKNNLIPLNENVSLKDFEEKAGRIFRTRGFDPLPEKIKQAITDAGHEKTFREKLNDVVWVPYVEGVDFLGFFSEFNNNMIVVVYQAHSQESGQVSTSDPILMLAILAHELGHRLYSDRIKDFSGNDPRIHSSLVNERSAFMYQNQVMGDLDPDYAPEDFSPITWSNLILGPSRAGQKKIYLSADDMRPYALSNGVFDVHPGSATDVGLKALGDIQKVVSLQGYSGEDARYLLDIIYLSASKDNKPRIAVSSENRSLIVHFVQKLLRQEPTGFADKDLMDRIEQVKKEMGDNSSPDEVSIQLLYKLMVDHYNSED